MKYSVDEIDVMRFAVGRILIGPHVEQWASWSNFDATVENRLRTYMQNGTAPEELIAAAEKVEAQYQAEMEASLKTALVRAQAA